MPTVSINWLSRHTGKDRRTIKKRLDNLPQDLKGKFDSVTALEAIYYGPSPDGNGFISQSEAVRRLTIAKEKENRLGYGNSAGFEGPAGRRGRKQQRNISNVCRHSQSESRQSNE